MTQPWEKDWGVTPGKPWERDWSGEGEEQPFVGAPGPDGQRMTQSELDATIAKTKANDHSGILSSTYRNFIEPWVPSGFPDFSDRGPVERLGDAASFSASLPVRMLTQGNYGAGDVAKYVGAEDTGATLEAGERDFLMNNAKQVKTVANVGDLAMGLPLPVPRLPRLPVLARKPSIPNPLPASVKARLSGGAQGVADDTIMRTMERARMKPADVVREVEKGQAAVKFGSAKGSMPETLADVLGDAGQRALRGAVTAPGAGSHIAKQVLDARHKGTVDPYAKAKFGSAGEELKSMGQRQRILDNFARAAGIRSKGTAYQTGKHLDFEMRSKATPAYAKGWKEAEPFDLRPALTRLMEEAAKYPEGSDIAARLKKTWRLFTMNDAPKGEPPKFRPLAAADELERFDKAKQALDDMITKATKSPNARRLLNQTRVDLLDAVHGGDRNAPKLNVAYADARSTYSGPASLKEAIGIGRTLLKKPPEVAVGEFNSLSKGDKQGALLGVMEALRLRLNKPDGGDYTQFFRQPNTAEILRAILPETKKSAATKPAQQFGEIISREGRMAETRNQAIYGSKTAPTLQDTEELTRWAKIATKLRGQGVISTVLDEVTIEVTKAFGLRADAAERVVRALLSSNPKKIKTMMKRLDQKYGEGAGQDAMMMVLQDSRNRLRAMAVGDVASRGTAVAYPETQDGRR